VIHAEVDSLVHGVGSQSLIQLLAVVVTVVGVVVSCYVTGKLILQNPAEYMPILMTMMILFGGLRNIKVEADDDVLID
jgi:hypothetical protein